MPLSTKKTTPSISYGKNNLDPEPQPVEEKSIPEKTVPATEFISLFGKTKLPEKKA